MSTSGAVFGEGLQLLLAAKVPEREARSFLGMCLRDWPEDVLREALLAAAGKADPLAYVRGVLKTKPKRPANHREHEAQLVKLREKIPDVRLAMDGKAFYSPSKDMRYRLADGTPIIL